MSARAPRSAGWRPILVCLLAACSAKHQETPPKAEAARVGAEAARVDAAPPLAVDAAPTPEPNPRAQGWDKLRLIDDVPLCVFADHAQRNQADFLKDVRTQTLRANASVVFGAFAAECIAEACHAAPTLECWVDPGPEPATLVVHTRFSYEQKQGAVCTQDCRPITAGCETPALKAGRYTVRYGARSFPLRIPSLLRQPCLSLQ